MGPTGLRTVDTLACTTHVYSAGPPEILAGPGDFGRFMTSICFEWTFDLEVVGGLFDEVGIPTSARNGFQVL
jgi:hypothetical protein